MVTQNAQIVQDPAPGARILRFCGRYRDTHA